MENVTNREPLGVTRVVNLITGEKLAGSVKVVEGINGQELLITKPFIIKDGGAFPYMVEDLGSAPAAVQVHPMNVIWSVPMGEFKELHKMYLEKTTGIVTEVKKEIII